MLIYYRAEIETKWKLEKVQEVKKLNLSISVIKSEMSKNEDQLKDLQQYRQFLEKLTKRHFALPGVHVLHKNIFFLFKLWRLGEGSSR